MKNYTKVSLAAALSVVVATVAVNSHARPFQRIEALNSTDEVPELVGERMFNRLDTDADGFLVIDELLTPRIDRAQRGFDRADTSEDGLIDFDEFSARRGERHEFVEENEEELRECVEQALGEEVEPELLSLEESFAEKDLNSDGYIDFSEAESQVTERVTERFTANDLNGDGLLDMDEFSAAAEAAKTKRDAVRTCVQQIREDSEDFTAVTDGTGKQIQL